MLATTREVYISGSPLTSWAIINHYLYLYIYVYICKINSNMYYFRIGLCLKKKKVRQKKYNIVKMRWGRWCKQCQCQTSGCEAWWSTWGEWRSGIRAWGVHAPVRPFSHCINKEITVRRGSVLLTSEGTPTHPFKHRHIITYRFQMFTYTQISTLKSILIYFKLPISITDLCKQWCSQKHNVNIMKTHMQLKRNITTLWRHLSPLHQLMSSRLPGCYNRVAISRGIRGESKMREKTDSGGREVSKAAWRTDRNIENRRFNMLAFIEPEK